MQYISERRNVGIHVSVFAGQNLMLRGAGAAQHKTGVSLSFRQAQRSSNIHCQGFSQGNPCTLRQPLNFIQQMRTIFFEEGLKRQGPVAQLVPRIMAARGE
jgi:hypothetical protein